MRFVTLLAFGLCLLGSLSALPVSKQEKENALIIDQIINIQDVQQILNELMEHGKQIGADAIKQLIEVAKGAAKEMLLKILEHLLEAGDTSYASQLPTAMIIDQIIDVQEVQRIINELIAHGQRISAALVQQLIDIAKGAAKEMLEKILETIVSQGSNNAYIIDSIISPDLIKQIIETIKNFGKEAAIELLNSLLTTARGIVKEALERLLEQLEETGTINPEAYIIDQIIDVAEVQRILNELIEHGKQISANVVQQLIEVAKGAAKEMLLKILEKIIESGATKMDASLPSTKIIDQIIDIGEVQRILNELLAHGQRISAALLQQMIDIAKGAAKEMLEKILETLTQQQRKEEAFILDRIIDPAIIQRIRDTIREHGIRAAIRLVKELIKTAQGIARDLLQRLLDRLEGSGNSTDIDSAYFIQNIIDPAIIANIWKTIKEQGIAAGIHIIKELLQTAGGLFKDLLEHLLTQLEGGTPARADSFDFDINIVNIINTQQIQNIINQLIEDGKGIGADALEELLEVARGAAKEMLQKILEHLKDSKTAYALNLPTPKIIDQIVDVAQVQRIINELIEHGKQISQNVVQQLLQVAAGAAREMLLKILEKLIESGVSY